MSKKKIPQELIENSEEQELTLHFKKTRCSFCNADRDKREFLCTAKSKDLERDVYICNLCAETVMIQVAQERVRRQIVYNDEFREDIKREIKIIENVKKEVNEEMKKDILLPLKTEEN